MTEAPDLREVSMNLLGNIQRVIYDIWILTYFGLMIPGWRFLMSMYLKYKIQQRIDGLLDTVYKKLGYTKASEASEASTVRNVHIEPPNDSQVLQMTNFVEE